MSHREKAPEKIGRYEIRGELGRGMMGVVYDAWDPSLGRRVALKVVHPTLATSDEEEQRFERRFLTEARIAARLLHPGIVVTHDVGRDTVAGTLFLAMERIQGRTVTEIVASDERPSWQEALRITARVADALHHAHEQGVVHRDIKPANIMVLPDGGVKVMDFGLAKIIEGNPEATAGGQWVGTPAFMSPEQIRGDRLDTRADIFSLGAVAYTLLTGHRPFVSDSVPRLLEKITSEDAEPPSRRVRGLPRAVDSVLARAMAREVDERYPTARAFGEDLEDVAAGRVPRHLRAQREAWEDVTERKALTTAGSLVDLPLREPPPEPDLTTRADEDSLPLRPPPLLASQRKATARPLLYLALGMFLAGGTTLALAILSPGTIGRFVRAIPPIPRSPTPTRDPSQAPQASSPSTPAPGHLASEARLTVHSVGLPPDSFLRLAVDGQTRSELAPASDGAVVTLALPASRHEVFAELRMDGQLQAARLQVTLAPGAQTEVELSLKAGQLTLRAR
jgi:serine/threonine protein kinase